MKKYIAAVVFVLYAQITLAQKDTLVTDTVNRKHYISVNATFFVKQILNFAGTTFAVSPYVIDYRFVPKNHGFRFSIGGDFSTQKNLLDSNQVTINSNTDFDFRLGYVFQKEVGKRWAVVLSTDLVNTISNSIRRDNTSSDITTFTTKSYAIGGGPTLGIQVNLSKRIGLYTETSLYYKFVNGEQTDEFLNFSEFNSKTSFSSSNVNFILPTSLFFYLRL